MNDKEYWTIIADAQLGYAHWQNLVREQDAYDAFQNECSLASKDPNCLGILGLGDLRERTSMQSKNLGGHNKGLHDLYLANKKLLAIMGNHDFTTPNWIVEMYYPSLKDFTNKEIQRDNGFDPKTTLVLNFTPKTQLKEILAASNPEKIKLLFLHQSIRELTTSLKQSYDISLEELEELGFGKNGPCTVFLGDLHNYGDAKRGNITAVYPGSLEMTDINEGVNGLKSNNVPSDPHDYRKFVIHFFPNTGKWTPVEIKPRPWMRGKAKTEKDCDKLEKLVLEQSKSWEKASCVLLSTPKNQTERFRTLLKKLNVLEGRVEEYNPEKDEEEEPTIAPETSLSWVDNKQNLLKLAEESQLDPDALDLLKEIINFDGSTHNPKNDVLNAWELWQTKGESDTSKKPKDNNMINLAPTPLNSDKENKEDEVVDASENSDTTPLKTKTSIYDI